MPSHAFASPVATMVEIVPVIDAEDKPANLPSPEVIVRRCRTARVRIKAANPDHDVRGVPLVDDSGAAYVWVKYGRTISMGEALTQSYVRQALIDDANAVVRVPCVYLAFHWGHFGYIVMEYIDGSICDESDAKLAASAVRSLITVQGKTTEPGPIGGGPITHRFFIDCGKSSLTYNSVQELEKHLNAILRFTGRKESISFRSEVETYGLRLCPCDMNRGNFMKDRSGGIVAIDFGASCFLPTSFFDLALCMGDNFTQLIARLVKPPETTQLNALLSAHYAQVPYMTDKIAVPRELKSRLK
ncbi:hypothetical protein H0H81_001509 [Sphagnurus paluster]|uniref:Aminoglycoside phosphotransferase domain-containing protein n=1 Tax=Sphagnurus paluster TaxID=117069 RepID=A0A9P7GM85_9AGAR|nr:hypothetical protein H0H81_001509 [Sphagnurus paluster]